MMLGLLQSAANHLWQSTLFAALAALVAWMLRSNRAQVRSAVWLVASLKFLVPFSLLTDLGSRLGWRSVSPPPPSGFALAVDRASGPFASTAPFTRIVAPPHIAGTDWLPPALFALWAIGTAAVAWVWWRRWSALRTALRGASSIDLRIGVPAIVSPAFSEPGVFGIRRPVLLLPAGAADRLTPSQLNTVVAHELCHMRRRDNLAAALHMVVEALFWFHPLVWWLGARLMEERESACDEEVLLAGNAPEEYAEGILRVCEMCLEGPLPCVAGVTGANLAKRVAGILSDHRPIALSLRKKVALAVAAVAALATPVIFGIVSAPAIRAQALSPKSVIPRFEVVSVKACKPSLTRGTRDVSPGRLRTGCDLLADENSVGLIQSAYARFAGGHTNPCCIIPIKGGPAWIHSELFEISATAEGAPSAEMMQGPMLQAVLEDRFRLKIRRVTTTGPIYNLTLTRGASKLLPFPPASCVQMPMTRPMPPVPSGQHYCQTFVAARQINAEGATLGEFAKILDLALDRQVIDKTGLSGRFNFRVEFAPDQATPGVRSFIRDAPADPAGTNTPTIFTAVQEQLGLKLTAATGPIEFLQIDHIERPSEN